MRAKKLSADANTLPRCTAGELDTIDHMLRLARGDADGEAAAAAGEGPATPALPRPRTAEEAESATHLLTSLAAKAFNAGDYWTSLRTQLEVDDYVSFINYCAAHRFPAMKAQHLYEWLSHYSDILRSGTPRALASAAPPQSLVTPDSRPSSASAQKKDAAAAAKGAKAKGGDNSRRASQVEPPLPLDPPSPTLTQAPRPFEELLLEEVRDFLGREVELYWKWEHTPRDTARRESVPTNAKGKKNTKGDRAKAQQQTEEEELRRQAAAALPPENIYLAPEEAEPFVKYFLAEGLMQHAALYRAAYTCEPPVAARPGRAVLLDLPPPLPSTDNARLLPSAAAAPSVPPSHDKKSGGAATTASAETTAAAATTDEPAPPSPRSCFRAAQMEELDVYERRFAEAEADRAGREKTEQLERDMQVLIGRHGTQKAVDDVYSEMEDHLGTRQLRILQRVAALERVLGMEEKEEEEGEGSKK